METKSADVYWTRYN